MQKFLIFLAIVGFIMLGVIVVGKSMVEKRIYGNMTPELKVMFETWYNSPLQLPDEAKTAEAFAPETVAAATAFRAEWDKVREEAPKLTSDLDMLMRSGQPLNIDSEDMQAQYQRLAEFQPLVEAFETLIAQPDFEIDALMAGSIPSDTNSGYVPNYLSFQVTLKLMRLHVYQDLHEGRQAEALATAESIVSASKASPYSLLISRLIAIAGGHIGSRTWYDAVQRVNDPALLRASLESMNRLSPRPEIISDTPDVMVTDQIGALRSLKRAGIEVDMDQKTGRELFAEFYRAQKKYNEQVVMPSITDEQKRKDYLARNNPEEFSPLGMFIGKSPFMPKFADRLGAATLFMLSVPNMTEASVRNTTQRVTFEVLRSETARRIAALETGASPSDIAALAPAYLPEVPEDWFVPDDRTDKTLRTVDDGVVYSFGPDKIDNKAAILYDPTNGTLSSGDIYFVTAK